MQALIVVSGVKISNCSKLPILEVSATQPNQKSMMIDDWLYLIYPQEAISSHPTDSKKGVSRVSIKK